MDSFGHLNTNASELIEWPDSLPTPLISREHVFNNRNTASEMSSSRLRKRRTMNETVELINAQWNFTNDQFSQFKSFFDNELENGAGNFIMVTYDQSPTAHFLRVVTRELNFFGAKYTGNRDDNLHSVSATLEVVDSDVYEIENWFDPVPPVPESPLPIVSVDFPTLCRDEFTLSFGEAYDLQPNTVYGIEIADNQFGPFVPHVYFGLQTAAEKSSLSKVLTFNNDYNGAAWFRMVRVSDLTGPNYAILSRPTNPMASVLAAPVVTVSNLTEITTQSQVTALGALSTGIVALYTDGAFVTPFSSIEDPMIWLSTTYRRAQKKYVQRQLNDFNLFGDMTTVHPAGVNIITMTGPAGAIYTYTRDQSDPQIDSYMPRLNSLDNNAEVQDHLFTGVLKVRCFKDGCRSPLTTILIDKVMWEISLMTASLAANDLSGSCDLSQTDPVSGRLIESGNSCINVYGGDCAFEAQLYGQAISAAYTAISHWDGSILSLARYQKTRILGTYLGWPIDQVNASFYHFSSLAWNRTFNGWSIAPKTHNWAITDVAGAFHPISVTESVCGSDSDPALIASLAEFYVASDIIISANIPQAPTPGCHENLNFTVSMARFDMVRATQWVTNSRDDVWLAPTFVPPATVTEPTGVSASILPYDEFSTYLDGDASTLTLDFNSGIDWVEAWTTRTGAGGAPEGYDNFDDYADGAVPDHSTHLVGDGYVPYNRGELWEVGEEWRFTSPDLGIIYQAEDWTSYADGALIFNAHGGTGWQSGENWITGTTFTEGSEDFTSYADGTFVGSTTGTSYTASESWIAR